MLGDSFAEWEYIKRRGDLRDRRVVLADPDDPTGRTRTVYEDLDHETPTSERMVLVKHEPLHSKRQDAGLLDEDYMDMINHSKAIDDIERMMRFGWELFLIERDRPERIGRD